MIPHCLDGQFIDEVLCEENAGIFAICMQRPYDLKRNFIETKTPLLPFSELHVLDTGSRVGVRSPHCLTIHPWYGGCLVT
jgi:hypothetical protein